MGDRLPLQSALPVGAIDTRATGWWAMIFVIFTEASLFAYLLFSYFYLAVQPHAAGTFPQGGLPDLTLALPNTAILLLSSVAVGWAQFNIEHDNNRRLCWGLGIGAVLGMIFLVVQYFEWAEKPFALASSSYSSLYFVVTGFHMAHVVVGVIMLWALFAWSAMGYFNRVRYAHVHIGALYWHFVDAVWIAVFFTFYVTPYLGLRG
ncbi:MAG TPA: cytochrome c oxidase subunit 3 [Rhizomicrobium sp.]|jgi:heme/copper-type cytochrome/quinol oxidase subunit 3|nr:cytochrome c oxidase subunit 3 [Rhizomicrobium sp.]